MNVKIWRKRSDNSLVGFCDVDYLGFEPGGDLTSYDVSVHDKEAVLAEWQAQQAPTQYQRLRAAAYPPASDYLDGIVKGDAGQVQTYIDACLAVKAKYPKP